MDKDKINTVVFPVAKSTSAKQTVQCHLRAVSLFIPATSEKFSVSATTASTVLITVSWS